MSKYYLPMIAPDNQSTDSLLRPSRDIFTVSRLNMEVRSALENSFPLLWISGEVSNLSQPRSGHLYFTLKDVGAQVRCALFRSRRSRLRITPSDGMQVIVRARITLFEPRGDFQLVVEHMEPAGEGALRQQIEALKTKLDAEGLFDADRKKPLPPYPSKIGVITSASGAAIHDVLTVLKRRFPAIAVIVYNVPVQGEQAAAEIRRMIEVADARNECDLLILTRGGGSLEDLMAFNDEQVVRTITACELPLVCAVGHEVDVTLADFAADHRAPTPSAAAELVSPDSGAILTRLSALANRIERNTKHRLKQLAERRRSLALRLDRNHPGRRLQQRQQYCDGLERRMQRQIFNLLAAFKIRHGNALSRLHQQTPDRRLRQHRERLRMGERQLHTALGHRIHHLREKMQGLSRELHAVSPLATLGRGYAIITQSESGKLITSTSDAAVGDTLEARLADGSLLCRVEKIKAQEPG